MYAPSLSNEGTPPPMIRGENELCKYLHVYLTLFSDPNPAFATCSTEKQETKSWAGHLRNETVMVLAETRPVQWVTLLNI